MIQVIGLLVEWLLAQSVMLDFNVLLRINYLQYVQQGLIQMKVRLNVQHALQEVPVLF